MKFFKLKITRKALIVASSFLLTSGLSGLDAYADYCYFEKPSDWGDPKVWAWQEDKTTCCTNGSWPGDMMTLIDEAKNLYRWDSKAGTSPNYIIIHDDSKRMSGTNTIPGTNGDTPFYNGATYKSDSSYSFDGDIPIPPVVANEAGAVEEWSSDGTTVTVKCANATLFITPYSADVVKVFALINGIEGEERRSITVSASPEADYNVSEEGDKTVVIAISGGTTVRVNGTNGLITFLDSEGNEKLSEANYLKNAQGNHSVVFNPMGDVAFYGGGYNGSWGNIINKTVTLNNTQNWGWSGGGYERCINIPFVASTSGYGVLFDDHWRGASMSPSASGLSYTSGAQNPIAYYYVGGQNLDEVLGNYTLLTGRQELPPYWALGYLTSRYSYWSESEAQGIINDIKGAGIPLDGIVFDLGWEGADESGMGNLRWYTPNFPDARKMMADWKERGIHTVAITEPYFTNRCENYSYPNSAGYFADSDVSNMTWLLSGRVGLLDATNPEALDWMYSFYKARTEEGMSGWWLDLGEPEQHDADSHHLGGSVSQVHNEFGQLWIERVHRGLKEDFPEMRPFLMPRSGTSGMQRFATFPWTGDISRSWGGLASQIPSLINMSMAGVSYIGSDVGGFADKGGGSPELYLRWVEFAALSPMMRTHSANIPEPTNSDYASILPAVKKFINLRYRLLPYTYTLSYFNTTKGWPLARPAAAYDLNPGVLASSSDSYLWGKDIFVAPVVDWKTNRSITFPQGEWIDLNDMTKVFRGGETINYSAALDVLPYFMRRGSFIPMFTKSEGFGSTSEMTYEDLTVLHYVDMEEEGEYEGYLFEDDRQSATSLEKNEYTLLRFNGKADGNGNYAVSVTPELGDATHFMPDMRTIRLRLLGYAGEEAPVLSVVSQANHAPALTRSGADEMTRKNSVAEVDAHDGHAYCITPEGELYMKTVIPSTSSMTVRLGDIDTGMEKVEMASNLSLEYVAGTVNYSIPSESDSAVIEYYSLDGRLLASESNLISDGHVHSINAPSLDGFCIARLKVTGKKGSSEKTVKFMF